MDALLIPTIEFRAAETYSVWGHWDGAWQALEDSAFVADRPAGAYLSDDEVLLPGILSPQRNNVRLPALSLSAFLISVENGQTVWWGITDISRGNPLTNWPGPGHSFTDVRISSRDICYTSSQNQRS